MDIKKLTKKVNRFKGALITRLTFLSNNHVTIYLKCENEAIKKIIFNGVFAFHDTGIINTELKYFDVNLLGMSYRGLVESKDLNPDDYFQAIFLNDQYLYKTELIIVFDEAQIIEI